MLTIDMIATGNRIRDLRDRSGMTTKDLMRFFGFENPTAIYKWLREDSLYESRESNRLNYEYSDRPDPGNL